MIYLKKCSYCGKIAKKVFIKFVPLFGKSIKTNKLILWDITHGICLKCKEEVFAEMAGVKVKSQ
jgi:hypothetical protein